MVFLEAVSKCNRCVKRCSGVASVFAFHSACVYRTPGKKEKTRRGISELIDVMSYNHGDFLLLFVTNSNQTFIRFPEENYSLKARMRVSSWPFNEQAKPNHLCQALVELGWRS